MTNRTSPFQSLCDCRCPLHHGFERTTYSDDSCACAITCATQPLTLLADQWGCALFLDQDGDLWHVTQLVGGQWEWGGAGEFDSRGDHYQTSLFIEEQLHLISHALNESIQ